MYPILIETDFWNLFSSMYSQGYLSDPAQACTIYLVLAIGSRSTSRTDISKLHLDAAWNLFSSLIAAPYLPSVQALLLMAIELMNCNKEGQAILVTGNAVRIAQSLGLHRALASHLHPHERGFVQQDYQLRTNVWWVCYCLDKKLCFEHGRPSAIQDEGSDVDMMQEFVGGVLPQTRPARFQFFSHMIRLCQILSEILSRLFSRTSKSQVGDDPLQHVQELDAKLLEWKTALPGELRLDSELEGSQLAMQRIPAALLHCMYYNTLVLIHRAALIGSVQVKQHPNTRIASSDTICLNASRALARLVNSLNDVPSSWPIIRYAEPHRSSMLSLTYDIVG